MALFQQDRAILDEFARIVSDRTPVISVSWGDCEKNMGQQEVQQENKYFQEAAAQGQSILDIKSQVGITTTAISTISHLQATRARPQTMMS